MTSQDVSFQEPQFNPHAISSYRYPLQPSQKMRNKHHNKSAYACAGPGMGGQYIVMLLRSADDPGPSVANRG